MKTLATMNHILQFTVKSSIIALCGLLCTHTFAAEVNNALFRIDTPFIIPDYKVQSIEKPEQLKIDKTIIEELSHKFEKNI